MQAVVFGSYTDEIDFTKNYTRMDTDAAFGTVCNKFMTQAILGMDLTVYGWGEHKRGFIALNDSIQALEIAINNDVDQFYSDYSPRVWNQLSFWCSMNELAEMIRIIAYREYNIKVGINHIESPRHEITEAPKHYSYKTDILQDLGYYPTRSLEEELEYSM
jgi:nucleoside-diphosphate-sugar epimerase